MSEFWENKIQTGYYDKIVKDGLLKNQGIQPNGHIQTFKEIAKCINNDDKHLDFACGPGTFIGLFGNGNSIGTDISANQIDYAKDNYSTKGTFLYLKEFDYNSYQNNFDVITVLGLIEFISDNEIINLLDKLFTCLKPDGKLVLTTPNYGGGMIILEKLINLLGKTDYKNQHINRFNKNRLKKLLSQSSFNDSKITKFMNFGIFSSLFSLKVAETLLSLVGRIFNDFFGFMFKVELKK